MSATRGVLTLACGAKRYLALAESLARSIRLRDPGEAIAVVTDAAGRNRQRFDRLGVQVVSAEASFGSGVEQKLHLDTYSPFEETLFIDADCLVFRPLTAIWDRYRAARGFGVVAYGSLGPDDKHPAIRSLPTFLERAGIDSLPAFNGGIYYFDRSPEARAVFGSARKLFGRRKELGLEKFKNAAAADEPLIAAAMRRCGVEPLAWDESATMGTALDCFDRLGDIDVAAGRSTFQKLGHEVSPTVIHFNMNAQHSRYYLRECWRLRLGAVPGGNALAGALGWATAHQRRLRSALVRRAVSAPTPT